MIGEPIATATTSHLKQVGKGELSMHVDEVALSINGATHPPHPTNPTHRLGP